MLMYCFNHINSRYTFVDFYTEQIDGMLYTECTDITHIIHEVVIICGKFKANNFLLIPRF